MTRKVKLTPEQEARRQASIEESARRKRAFDWMDGWCHGAAMTADKPDWDNADFLAGWKLGKEDRRKAAKVAESVSGYTFLYCYRANDQESPDVRE